MPRVSAGRGQACKNAVLVFLKRHLVLHTHDFAATIQKPTLPVHIQKEGNHFNRRTNDSSLLARKAGFYPSKGTNATSPQFVFKIAEFSTIHKKFKKVTSKFKVLKTHFCFPAIVLIVLFRKGSLTR